MRIRSNSGMESGIGRGWGRAMIASLSGILIAATVVSAQTPERRFYTQAGTWEFGGSLGFSSSTSVSDGSRAGDAAVALVATPSASYFVAEGFSLVLNPVSVIYASQGNVSDLELLALGGAAYVHRAHPRIFPFVEGVAGFGYSRFSATVTTTRQGFAWGARGGVKVLVTPSTLLNVGAEYLQTTLNRSTDSGRNGIDRFAVTLGVSFWLY